jgi:hypothetical protein
MDVVSSASRNSLPHSCIERVDLAGLELLERSLAQRWRDMNPEQFCIPFYCAQPDLASSLVTRRANGNPMLDPIPKGELVGRDMLASVASAQ